MHSKKSVMAMIATLLGLAAALGGTAWAASNERILYSFSGGADGDQPMSELVFDAFLTPRGLGAWPAPEQKTA